MENEIYDETGIFSDITGVWLVVPGDTVIFKLDLTTDVRRGCASMKGYAIVGDKICAEAEFLALITKNK